MKTPEAKPKKISVTMKEKKEAFAHSLLVSLRLLMERAGFCYNSSSLAT
jgi:hypothetical protein